MLGHRLLTGLVNRVKLLAPADGRDGAKCGVQFILLIVQPGYYFSAVGETASWCSARPELGFGAALW